MANGINKAIIVGRLGQDPVMRYTAAGKAVCSLSVATSESWRDKQTGEKVQETEWHRVTGFDKLAEIMGEYLKKGSLVYIEGKLKTRKYDDKEGVTRYSTDIIARDMQMLGSRGEAESKPSDSGFRGKPETTMDDFKDEDLPW